MLEFLYLCSLMFHSLEYLRSTPSAFKDIGIRKSEFVTKTQFIYKCPMLDAVLCLQKNRRNQRIFYKEKTKNPKKSKKYNKNKKSA